MPTREEMFLTCPKCKQVKPSDEFYRDRKNRNGYSYYCKQCECLRLRNDYATSDAQRRVRLHYGKTDMARYTRLKSNAKRRGTEFSIDKLEFLIWFQDREKVCHYCGFGLNTNGSRDSQISIDRKDNSLGYTIGNIELSCQQCNTIKGNVFTESEMLEIADKYLKPKAVVCCE